VTLLADVAALLRRHRIPFALIGAGAMAVHGVSRSTADLDLLATDDRCLDPALWRGVGNDVAVDVRRGDAADPLAGVVRLTRSEEIDLDVIVGRPSWQRDVLARAAMRAEHEVPVVTLSDLILLKLYAGGSQDAWDVEQLLAVDASGAAVLEVEQRLDVLPADSRDLWDRLRAGRR
jgi:hypothetical protein